MSRSAKKYVVRADQRPSAPDYTTFAPGSASRMTPSTSCRFSSTRLAVSASRFNRTTGSVWERRMLNHHAGIAHRQPVQVVEVSVPVARRKRRKHDIGFAHPEVDLPGRGVAVQRPDELGEGPPLAAMMFATWTSVRRPLSVNPISR